MHDNMLIITYNWLRHNHNVLHNKFMSPKIHRVSFFCLLDSFTKLCQKLIIVMPKENGKGK